MKKFAIILLSAVLFMNTPAFCIEDSELENIDQTSIEAPIWGDYVAPKYKNPRRDFKRETAVGEIVVGVLASGTLFGLPVGIPMIIHGISKNKMISYSNRKIIFDKMITQAELIEDENERETQYQYILRKCKLKEKTKQHYIKKAAKKETKQIKKDAKAAIKQIKQKQKYETY